jgi:uncharacterized protein (UPF0276 family)
VVDRVGLGWRPQLAAGILSNLDKIDIVEVIADDYYDAPAVRVRSLRTLMSQVPLTLHGIGLGPASTGGIDRKRMEQFARLIDQVKPESWSEHLAWVRAGGRELGHLAAPCRNQSTIDATLSNLDLATRMVGRPPLVENIASLIDPPASPLDEAQWLSAVMHGGEAGLLLDLHNVHTNAFNFGFDAFEFLDAIPLERVGTIHIAGGRPQGERILDDHLHDVPDPVFGLVEYVAARAPQSLTVILERDGSYPAMGDLLAQLDRARAALARGRAGGVRAKPAPPPPPQAARLTDPAFESFLAKIWIEPAERARFLQEPHAAALRAGLRVEQAEALARIDRVGLEMAARSFANKRSKRPSGH